MYAKIHPVFCVSQFKKVIGSHEVISELPKEMAVEDKLLEQKEILKSREVLIDGNKVFQVLVKWKGRIVDEATWMKYYDFCNQFLTSNLVDKADLIGGRH